MRILNSAGNNSNALLQLARFSQAMQNTGHQVKVAAYQKSSPKGMNIDWSLDCLFNMFNSDQISENDNLKIYYDQILYYKPDLVISDLEYFTSYLATASNIPLWQYNSSLINFAVTQKYDLGLFKKYAYLLQKNNPLRTQRIINIIDNSDRRLVYSHLGDSVNPPELKEGFEWVRPYHMVGKNSVPCRHNLVAGLSDNNKNVLSLLKQHADSVAFTNFPHERHTNLWLKDIGNSEEYFCNLKNCQLFVCEGQTSFLADAFYNNKYSVVMTNFQDVECVTNSVFSQHLGLSSMIYQIEENLHPYLNKPVQPQYNQRVKYLHEMILI
jgi:uncharacterized protein (TIGR00661 family)